MINEKIELTTKKLLYTLCFNNTLSLLKQLALCSKSNFIAHCITAAEVFCGPVEIAMASNEKKKDHSFTY